MTHRPIAPITLDVNADVIRAYAELTRDYNPIHLDEAFAAGTAMGGVIAHGTMALNLIWQALSASPVYDAAGWTLEVRFVRPVRPGDRITAEGSVLADGTGYEMWVRKADGERVIEGIATLGGCEAPQRRASSRAAR